jgi:hypothetical protein
MKEHIPKCHYSKVPCYRCKYHPKDCGLYNNPANPAFMLSPKQMKNMIKSQHFGYD